MGRSECAGKQNGSIGLFVSGVNRKVEEETMRESEGRNKKRGMDSRAEKEMVRERMARNRMRRVNRRAEKEFHLFILF